MLPIENISHPPDTHFFSQSNEKLHWRIKIIFQTPPRNSFPVSPAHEQTIKFNTRFGLSRSKGECARGLRALERLWPLNPSEHLPWCTCCWRARSPGHICNLLTAGRLSGVGRTGMAEVAISPLRRNSATGTGGGAAPLEQHRLRRL